MIRVLLLLLVAALPARAEEVVAGLSQSRISITTNFDGSELLIFGAVKREAAPPEGPLQVVIAVAGPSTPVTVRRKDRRFGIWVNAETVEVDRAPSFYAVATSGEWSDSLLEIEDLRHSISVPRAIRAVGTGSANPEDFTDALIRIRREAGLYQTLIGAVDVEEATLFSTRIGLPANLIEGVYDVRFFLTRNGRVIATGEKEIGVFKVGLEKFLYALAHQQPLIYGLLSLAIAVGAGWGASAAFRYMRS